MNAFIYLELIYKIRKLIGIKAQHMKFSQSGIVKCVCMCIHTHLLVYKHNLINES